MNDETPTIPTIQVDPIPRGSYFGVSASREPLDPVAARVRRIGRERLLDSFLASQDLRASLGPPGLLGR